MKKVIPKIVVKRITLKTNIDLVARFISPSFNKSNKTLPFADYSYKVFPELLGKIHDDMTDKQVREIITPVIKNKLNEYKVEMKKKIKQLQIMFDKINDELLIALAEVHETKWPNDCFEVICYVGFIPVCPRNVKSKQFWVSYGMEDKRIIKTAIHEMGHFMFYEKWKEINGEVADKDLGRPNPRWYLEEIIVDPLLNDKRIQKIVPSEQKAYDQFYTETIDGISINDTIKNFYKESKNIEDFINKSYQFVQKNIEEIMEKCG